MVRAVLTQNRVTAVFLFHTPSPFSTFDVALQPRRSPPPLLIGYGSGRAGA